MLYYLGFSDFSKVSGGVVPTEKIEQRNPITSRGRL